MSRMFLTIAAAGLGVSTTAAAHDGHHGPDHNQIDGARIEAHGSVSQYGVFGVGGRLEFALVPDGFIGGDVHDEFALSLGADVYFAELNPIWYDSGAYVLPVAVAQWNFYLGEDWSIFPEAGVALHVDPDDDGWNGRDAIYVAPEFGFGARYHFAARNALLLRASSPGGFQVGLTF